MIIFFEFFNCNKYRRFLIATKFFLKKFLLYTKAVNHKEQGLWVGAGALFYDFFNSLFS